MRRMNKTRQQLADFFLAALKEDRLPWRAVWQCEKPRNAVTGAQYRGVNNLLLSHVAKERGYTDPRWCTFLQAKNRGWSVKKGAKGVPVEYWAYIDPALQKMLTWAEVREIQKTDPDRAKTLELRYRLSTVFNGEEIKGIPTREAPPPLVGTQEIVAGRDLLLKNMKLAYREQGVHAYYRPREDEVTLPPMARFESAYGYFCTFLHECGHATAHPTRLDRKTGARGTEEYAREELRAEIASAFVSQELGLQMEQAAIEENLDLHKAYIQGWISVLQAQPEELFAAIREANRISDYLIQAGEFHREQVIHLTQPLTWNSGDLELTLKNCYTRGGYSLSIRGSDSLKGLPGELEPYRMHISEVRVEEGITEVGKRALWKLPELQYVSLPHTLERIGSWAFDYCPQLHTVEYCGSIAEWDALEKGDCFLPEQFQNELERADRPFALTAGEHCIIRAEEMAPEHSMEADYELELE